MSDIPANILKSAKDALRAAYGKDWGSEEAEIIARALMAADEAATKRERERASSVVEEIAGHYRESSASFKAARVVNGAAISDGIARLLDDVAAILKGEA